MKIFIESIDWLIGEIFKLIFLLVIIAFPLGLMLFLVFHYGESGKVIFVGICFLIAFFGLIWCFRIIRDPHLSREEKWNKLFGG
ncbi:hypothetical protein ACLSY8_05045 [Avibacterium avium]|uniref:hypothetical protein n=1 Tax=Avibacterium avium TaxID=751 RepID=UPI003BF881FD